MSRRQSVLGDAHIKSMCYDQFMPVSTGKLNAILKPQSSSILTSVRPPAETPQPNYVPYYTAVNSSQELNGQQRVEQIKNSGKSIMSRVGQATTNYDRLAGAEQRSSVLTQDLFLRNIPAAKKPVPNKVKPVTVELTEDESNNPLHPIVQQSIAQRLLNKHSSPVTEQIAPALAGAVRQIETTKDPELSSDGLLGVLATNRQTSALFVKKRLATQPRGQPGSEGAVLPADFSKETLPGSVTSGPRGRAFVPDAPQPEKLYTQEPNSRAGMRPPHIFG